MLKISRNILIPDDELHFDAIQASGPGGQNVNRVNTAIQLRFCVDSSPSLPSGVKRRLRKSCANSINKDGVLIIQAQCYRSQERNRNDALQRLKSLIRKALTPPKKRKPTKPGKKAKEKRLKAKKKRGERKRLRGSIDNSES